MKAGFKIQTLHAFIATEADGTEGVIGAHINGMMMPFVAADPVRVDALRDRARDIARASGRPVVLAKFEIRTDLETIGGAT